MSGICGLLRLNGAEASPEPVSAMLKAMHYRGPDGLHHLCAGPVALGQARLHVNRDSAGIPLPYAVPGTDLSLVLDGRLDNAPELADTLQLSRNKTDAELLAAAYLCWGDDCAAQLDGDFAFAIWDASRSRLLCARDHTGTRPFYYHLGKSFFAFASELPPLLALAEAEPERNQDTVTEFLAQCWVSNEHTFWQGFNRLPPAHALEIEQGTLHLRRYWQPDFDRVLHYANENDYCEHYRELIADIIRRQTRSDFPVAFEVSGGLDSSALFSVANNLHRLGSLQAPDIAGYTLDFRGCGDADEVDYAEAVGTHCGRVVEAVEPTFKALAWYCQRARTRGEFCGVPNGVMSKSVFDRAAAAGSRVLVDGTGGDEWLDAGDAAYVEAASQRDFSRLVELLRDQACRDGWVYASGRATRSVIAGSLSPSSKSRLRKMLWGNDAGIEHLSLPVRQDAAELLRRNQLPRTDLNLRAQWQWPLAQQLSDSYALLAHESSEVLAAESGVVLHRPYWSRRLIDFSIELPRYVLTRPGDNRTLHRAAMSGLLAQRVCQRYHKAEFSCSFQGLAAQVAQRLLAGDIAIESSWIEDTAFRRVLGREAGAAPGTANWAIWFLFCCAAL